MRVFDTSFYDDQSIENYLLEVLPVNKSTWSTFHVAKEFSVTLNSSNLNYKRVSNENCLIDLPDGIYEFKMSYSPNLQTLCHYYHMRTSALRLKYVEALGKHFDKRCMKDQLTYLKEGQNLIKVEQFIKVAEYTVSEKHDKKLGIKFYNQAFELIKQIDNECKCI